ncbi:MAG TPA: diguanylate cyclase [Longimicrobiaceae bacterium]|nr:diguanylate cyclase [Longimicrobiaceae bacterium]
MTNIDSASPTASPPADAAAMRAELDATRARENALRSLLAASAEMYRRPAPADLMRMVLHAAVTLTGAADGALAATALGGIEGETARSTADEVLDVRVATGGFAGAFDLDGLPPEAAQAARDALREGRVQAEGGRVAVPLRVNDRPAAVVVLQGVRSADAELLATFAEIAGGALGLVLVGSGASMDAVTGTYVRAAAGQRLRQMLKGVHRRGEPVAVLRVRIGDFAALTEKHGPAAGDRALMAAGDMLRYWLRDTDVVGRWGPDEFLVVLPDTGPEGERIVTRRLHEQGGWLGFQHDDEQVDLSLAIGAATLPGATEHETGILDAEAFEAVAQALADGAGQSLQAVGGGGVGDAHACAWTAARPGG